MNAETVVLDSSVLVAIFKNEADARRLTESVFSYRRRIMSTATWLETAIVCEGSASKGGGAAAFAALAVEMGVEIIPFTQEQSWLALEAFKRFGKGRDAKASLNFGDCITYALAKELAAPLLFKGNDFIHTDLQPA